MMQCRLMLLYTQTYPAALCIRLQSSDSDKYNDITIANKTGKLNPNPVNYSDIFKVGEKSKKHCSKHYKMKTPISYENSTELNDGINCRNSHETNNTEEVKNPLSLQASSQFDTNNNIGNSKLQNCKLNIGSKYPVEKEFEEKVKLLLKEIHDAAKCGKFRKELETRLR